MKKLFSNNVHMNLVQVASVADDLFAKGRRATSGCTLIDIVKVNDSNNLDRLHMSA